MDLKFKSEEDNRAFPSAQKPELQGGLQTLNVRLKEPAESLMAFTPCLRVTDLGARDFCYSITGKHTSQPPLVTYSSVRFPEEN